MKTNKPKLKTQRKTRINIQLSQTLTMNSAHDIKILEYWICIYSLTEDVFKKVFPGIKNFAKYKQISNLQRKKNIFEKKQNKNKTKQNKTQFSMVKSQLMVYQKEQSL